MKEIELYGRKVSYEFRGQSKMGEYYKTQIYNQIRDNYKEGSILNSGNNVVGFWSINKNIYDKSI